MAVTCTCAAYQSPSVWKRNVRSTRLHAHTPCAPVTLSLSSLGQLLLHRVSHAVENCRHALAAPTVELERLPRLVVLHLVEVHGDDTAAPERPKGGRRDGCHRHHVAQEA